MIVLIVDDNPVNRRLPEILLTQLGHTCLQAGGGAEALVLLQRRPIDCVLLDISMPDMTGEAVCAQVRADAALAARWLVAYTAHALPDETARFMAAGFDDVLVKPISRDSLARAMARAAEEVGRRAKI